MHRIKKMWTSVRVMLALFVVTLYPTLATPEGNLVRIATGEWSPWLSETSPNYGAASAIVTEAFSNEGVKIDYGFFPWARSFMFATEAKDWDATIVWRKNDKRSRDFLFSDPVHEGHTMLFHRAGQQFDWKKFKDLARYRFGATMEYSYGEQFDQARDKGEIKVEIASDDESNMRKLKEGRIDLFPVEEFVGIDLAKRLFGKEATSITYVQQPINISTYHLLVAKKHPRAKEIIETFNRGLAKIEKSRRRPTDGKRPAR